MLRTTGNLMVLLVGLCLVGCDSKQTPPSASPQPLPASIPYRPAKTQTDTPKQVAFATENSRAAARPSADRL
jgi:hypothetical protein